MRSTGIYEAKQNFSALIDAVEAGEEVVITRHGKPAVRLLPVAPKSTVSQRQIEHDIAELGRLRARVKPGPGWRELRRIVFSNALFPSPWHPEHGSRRV